MSEKKDRGRELHLAAGAIVGSLFVIGYGREAMQHDLDLTLHQWLEALAWPAGGLVAIVVGLAVIGAVKWARRGDD